MRRYLSLYAAFLRRSFRVLLEYRTSFVVGVASTIVAQSAGIAGLWVVLRRVPAIHGWTFAELLLVQGLLVTARSLEHMLADNLWVLGTVYIRQGDFDRFLVRPLDPLFHLLADRFQHDGIGELVAGVSLTAYAWKTCALPATPAHVGYAVAAVVSGGVIFVALNLLTATTAFWVVESLPLTRAVHELHQLARYPLGIYGRGLRALLTWVVPYGFASFYPASALFGRDVGPLAALPPLVALVLAWISYRFWRFGLRHYAGTGT